MKVYTNKAQIHVMVSEGDEVVSFQLKPLTFEQKTALGSLASKAGVGDDLSALRLIRQTLAFCVVSVSGLEDEDGQPWNVSHAGGELCPDSLDALFNLPCVGKMMPVAMGLLKGVPAEGAILDGEGNPVPGVTVSLGKIKAQ